MVVVFGGGVATTPLPLPAVRDPRYRGGAEQRWGGGGAGASCSYLPSVETGGIYGCFHLGTGRKAKRRDGAVAAAAYFWQEPAAIEMEAIKDTDHLDDILRRSQEDPPHPVVIDWMAQWCRKCIYLKPKLEKLAVEFPRIKFYYVDVNSVPQALVKRGNISKMPTIQFWKDGEMKAEVIGGHKAWLVVEEVREMIQTNM